MSDARTLCVPMTLADVPQVLEIDRLSFPLPWSAASYKHELSQNKHAHFFVALESGPGRWQKWLGHRSQGRELVVSGDWDIVNEAHISTIAVHPLWRGKGIGEELLKAMLARALKQGAVEATLEVRVSHIAAQTLYRKYGFEDVGLRKNYYRDNGEDALLMTAKPLRISGETMNNDVKR